MIDLVGKNSSTWAELPHKFEAGTPNIAGAIGFAAAVRYLNSIGSEAILRHEQALVRHALAALQQSPGVRLFGPSDVRARAGVVSFRMDAAHPHDISTVLDREGIAIRAGHHCAQLVMQHFKVGATARASFYFYNTLDEVDRLVRSLDTVRSIFDGA
jgi:cysteine desulfurase/selenocysteine lyase